MITKIEADIQPVDTDVLILRQQADDMDAEAFSTEQDCLMRQTFLDRAIERAGRLRASAEACRKAADRLSGDA